MALKDFAEDLQLQVFEKRNEGYASPDLAFTATIVEQIYHLTNVNEFNICHLVKKNSAGNIQGEIYGYGLSENNEVLSLYYSLYDANTTTEGLTKVKKADFDRAVNRLQGFYIACTSGWRNELIDNDPDNEALPVAELIVDNQKKFVRVNLVILTNHIMDDYGITRIRVGGIAVESDIWDIRKIYGNLKSGLDHVSIDLDFAEEFKHFKLPCVEINVNNYRCISTLFPASLLYRLYEQHNTNLLMNNVRLFLGLKKKGPNASMRDTLLHNKDMFLAYNNGLTAIAKGVEIEEFKEYLSAVRTDDNPATSSNDFISTGVIKRIIDFQIVNGGQTTAVIFNTKKANRDLNLLGVYVNVKIIVLDDEQSVQTEKISKATNDNNKIKIADYTSNNKFNLLMQDFSRSLVAPNEKNKVICWYYERIRGQYTAELESLRTKEEISLFKSKYPLEMKFDKELLAKVMMAWSDHPENAVKGASTTYSQFIKPITERGIIPDERYFKEAVGRLIIYKFLLHRPETKQFGNAKAPVIAYTMAYLCWFTQGRLDLLKIWKNQGLSPNLQGFLVSLAYHVKDKLQADADASNTTVLSWSKAAKAFESLKRMESTHLSYNTITEELMAREKIFEE